MILSQLRMGARQAKNAALMVLFYENIGIICWEKAFAGYHDTLTFMRIFYIICREKAEIGHCYVELKETQSPRLET